MKDFFFFFFFLLIIFLILLDPSHMPHAEANACGCGAFSPHREGGLLKQGLEQCACQVEADGPYMYPIPNNKRESSLVMSCHGFSASARPWGRREREWTDT